jgi:signal transduction histidine kinase
MKKKSVQANNPYKSVIQTCIMKAHGGEIKVASEKGKGSEFRIQLPLV